ncbi:antibiotic biosynthesis monooxygenase [Trinickia terrae]|uniref:Antibiotic biosynthesis monooxygenase n=1 Tax=Trinickia terrae TaxID=2571161 RepID=A0A4U1I146_9BURK|nr:antibiotic biosynthesis monooxygenase family protein [Trinickia terrae]TKC86867.1 antibiotic biosynthesis monooxygenase [Trinickia terrae]
MILEIASFQISTGNQIEFEAAFEVAQNILAGMPGYLGHELDRCIEDAGEYRLLVQWRSVEDHMQGFRESPRFAQWRALLSPFFAAPPSALHYERVFSSGK